METISQEYGQNLSQALVLQQEMTQLRGGMTQIPVFFTLEPDIDFELFKKAIDIEIERNDSLRIHFTKNKKKHTITQHFVSPYKYADVLGKIEMFDLSGKTKEKQDKLLKKLANRPLRYEKFQLLRVVFLRTYDGKTGVFLSVTHLACDAYGVFITVTDLLEVYKALKTDQPLPKPLNPFEKLLAKNLQDMSPEKDEEFKQQLTEYHDQLGPLKSYTGIINKNLPHKAHDGNTLKNVMNIFFRDKSGNLIKKISKETYERWIAFCQENSVTFNSLVLFGLSSYWAKINDCNDICYMNHLACRATISDKYCAGVCMKSSYPRFLFQDEDSVLEALAKIEHMMYMFYRNASRDTRIFDPDKAFNINGYNYYGCAMFSMIGTPYVAPEGWKFDFDIVSQGQAIIPLYLYLIPDLLNGGMKFCFEYMKEYTNELQNESTFNGICTAIEAAIADKTLNFKQIKDSIQ